MDTDSVALWLIAAGVMVCVAGAVLLLGSALGLGGLPGDVLLRKGNARIYIPIATSIILSIVLTIIANVAVRLLR